jgi:hypothetical protein
MLKRMIVFVWSGFTAAAMAVCIQLLGCTDSAPPPKADAGSIDARAVDAMSGVPFDAMNDSGLPLCGTMQCSNCIDDDSDGFIDGSDVHCVFSVDNDESTFATGIPGDAIDPERLDCIFDINADDGCEIDVCCLTDTCAPSTDCSITQMCIDYCTPAAPAGCDCFGCCTICYEGTCKDILTIPASTPGWDCDNLANLSDPVKCPACFKVTECSTSCDTGQNADCILCPGQRPDELPAECNMQNECPAGRWVCDVQTPCPSLQYCAHGCCVDTLSEF